MKRLFETAACEAVRNSIFWELSYEKQENQTKVLPVDAKTSTCLKHTNKSVAEQLFSIFFYQTIFFRLTACPQIDRWIRNFTDQLQFLLLLQTVN